MNFTINDAGGPGEDLASKASQYFREAAMQAGIDLVGYDPEAPLEKQIIWAQGRGLKVGTTYLVVPENLIWGNELWSGSRFRLG